MKEKHLKIRMEQCKLLAGASNCVRLKVGALILDPVRNVILMDGYNGAPRDGGDLCGGDYCFREMLDLPSGDNPQIGCIHAEANAIYNAAAAGVKTAGAWMIVNVICCLGCAKAVHHAGIKKVILIDKTYVVEDGIKYLQENGVVIEFR